MKNLDFEFLKKKYGENFAKLCRNLFPSLLEQEGVLSKLITESFAESKFLFGDITKNNLQNEFKNHIMSFVEKEDEVVINNTIESPFELMKKAGYTLYKCETDSDVKSFRKYWKKEEELCTFWNDGRINTHLIFFAVKDNVNQIKRENFKNPLRQDEYGTSVISIQFTKSTPSTISIKNRYNHRVVNPDATFSNDLENIYAGLKKSFIQEYDLNLLNETRTIEIPGHVLANDGRFYKYNYEIDNVYYCPNNIIINQQREVTHLDKNKQLLFDYFILDFEKGDIKKVNRYIKDDFISGIPHNIINKNKIQVQKANDEKVITIISNNHENVSITLDNKNRIIKYSNPNITETDDKFLYYNNELKELNLPNLVKTGNEFLYFNKEITELNLPNLVKTGKCFLGSNKNMEKVNLPSLVEAGYYFLDHNERITELNLPKLKTAGISFLRNNKITSKVNLPSLMEAQSYFLYSNEALTEVSFPSLMIADSGFLKVNKVLTNFNAPRLMEVGSSFLYCASNLTTINVTKLNKSAAGFLYHNKCLTELNLPNLTEIKPSFLYKNEALTVLNIPKLKEVDEGFLCSHPKRGSFTKNFRLKPEQNLYL